MSTVHIPHDTKDAGQRFFSRPLTSLGWWSVKLMVAFLAMGAVNQLVLMQITVHGWVNDVLFPLYGFAWFGIGLAAMVTALIAVTRRHERSWLVFLPLLPGLFVIMFVIGEFASPH